MIRANVGDEIHVNLYNKLYRNISIHVEGLKYNVLTSDGAEYYNNCCCKRNHGEQAVTTAPGQEKFREFVLFEQNGIRLLDKNGNLIKTTETGEEGGHVAPDHEDTGENVTIRLIMPADKPRNISFVLHGHQWRLQTDNPLSDFISVQEAISVGGAYNIKLYNGASMCPGDYLYRSGSLNKIRQGTVISSYI
ncbi:MAG: multicopper oxidase domain-containing protein [Hominilimicola sp.]